MKHLLLSLMLTFLFVEGALAQYETMNFGFDTEYEAIVDELYNNLAFAPEIRIGGASTWEQGQHDFRGGSPPYGAYNAIGTTQDRTWQNGVEFDWEVIYNTGSGAITWRTQYSSEANPVETTATATNKTVSDVFIRTRARADGQVAEMYDITIDTGSGPQSVTGTSKADHTNLDDLDYLWIKDVNFPGNTTVTVAGKGKFTWTSNTNLDGSNLAAQLKFSVINDRRDYGDTPSSYTEAWAYNIDGWEQGNGTPWYMRMGDDVDTDAGNQPSAGADGDDTDADGDDEDGVVFLDGGSPMNLATDEFVPGNTYTLQVTYTLKQYFFGLDGFLGAWIDWDRNNVFDVGENLLTLDGTTNALTNNVTDEVVTYSFTAPAGASGGDTYARVVLVSDNRQLTGSDGPYGDYAGGEVEDYKIIVQGGSSDTYDWGDLPDAASGTAPGDYETLSANGGPSHVIDPNIYMGYSTVDDESDGQPTGNADGDDNNGTTPDDEDGPQTALTFTEGEYALVTIAATNNTGSAATLYGFIDWNGDGDFNDMHETASVTVPDGSSGAQVKLNFDTVPTNAPSSSYARFRLSTDNAAANPTGQASDGEVEDFPITINDILTPTPIESSSCLGALMSDVVSTDPPSSFPDPAAVGAINGRDNAFNVSVGGDFYVAGTGGTPVGGAEAEGRVLVLGDLVINRVGDKTYSMGFVGAGSGIIPDANTDHVTVGGDVYVNAHDHPSPGTDGTRISLGSGSVGGESTIGNIRYKGTLFKAGGAAPAMDGDFPDPVDVASLSQVINDMSLDMTPYSNPFTDLEALSSCWASFPQSENVSITSGASLITISSTNGASGLYVINITSDYFDGSNGNSIQFSNFPDDATILFNMNQAGSGETFNFNMTGSWSGLSQALRLRIMWHFPDAATINFTGAELWGSVYVANSNSTTTFGTVSINGRVAVAGDLRHEGSDGSEFHNYPFQGELPCECGTGDYDWGDNPDTGNGAGTGNYLTLNSDNGPRHEIVPGLFLGSDIDAEADGQPTTDADGDDNSGTPDDEDGVTVADLTMSEGSSAAVRVNATNTTGGTALLVGFIDFNKDGDFGDPGERVITTVPDGSNNAQFTLNFTVPSGSAGTTYARFRLSRSAVASLEYGECFDGEVEDYKVTINGTLDWGDAPDAGDNGTGNGNYRTLSSDDGPRHTVGSGLLMGTTVDTENDGQPSVNAVDDDLNGATPDDEDGVVMPAAVAHGSSPSLVVSVQNPTASQATLTAWIDYNGNGAFEDGTERATGTIAASTNGDITLNFPTVPAAYTGTTYARLRLTTDGVVPSTGAASDGEVEDYVLDITENAEYDWGDAPDAGDDGTGPNNYRTLNSDNGPRHLLGAGPVINALVDAEVDGQPTAAADGDDTDAQGDDEDGVSGTIAITEGAAPAITLNIQNPTGLAATVTGWIDYNQNGQFEDGTERATATIAANTAGTVTLTFPTVPGGSAGSSFARFRVSTEGVLPSTGASSNGEVEDHPVNISSVSDWGDVPDTYGTDATAGNSSNSSDPVGPSHSLGSDIYLGAETPDSETQGQPTTGADGDDNNGSTPDDEDGVSAIQPVDVTDASYSINVTVVNNTASVATLIGWIDFNRDGVFQPAEGAIATVAANGNENGAKQLSWPDLSGLNVTAGQSYLRLRLTTDALTTADVGGAVADGEIEDHPLNITDGKDWGDAPDTYGTDATAGNSGSDPVGPNHALGSDVYLGAEEPDAETDGQPTSGADGDDNNGTPDDEDGLSSIPALDISDTSYNLDVTVVNNTANTATLVGWIDFNLNGVFESGEGATASVAANGADNGIKQLSWTGLSLSQTGQSYIRLRITTGSISTSDVGGAAVDGEIEDHPLLIADANTGGTDLGDAPASYGEAGGLLPDGSVTIRLGATIDGETSSYYSDDATGDDVQDGSDDEDGVTFVGGAVAERNPSSGQGNGVDIVITTFREGRGDTFLEGWIDLNGDGDFSDAGEKIVDVNITSGMADDYTFTGNIEIPNSAVLGKTFARFRYEDDDDNEDTGVGSGSNGFGEVEDYEIVIDAGEADFGDAPVGYEQGNNASHTLSKNTLRLGDTVDGDNTTMDDGGGNADGDDAVDAFDDEDAVSFPTLYTSSTSYGVTVKVFNNSGGNATLVGWIDFNKNGTFESGEGVSQTVGSSGSVQDVSLDWTGLSGLTGGQTYARFRLTTGTLGTGNPNGSAPDGEVEDYPLDIDEPPIGVDLTSFTAQFVGDAVHIAWETNDKYEHAGYNLYRSTEETGAYVKVNDKLIASEPENDNIQYNYIDHVPANAQYYYKLEAIGLDGNSTFHGPISVSMNTAVEEDEPLPNEFNLAQNYPNPFNPVTTISYTLPATAEVRIVIYNIQGKIIRNLVNGQQAAGAYNIVWDAKDDLGNAVPTGLYIYKMQAGDYARTLKMTLLK